MASEESSGTRVFISYRRDDSIGIAGRIRDRLTQEYGADRVFFDIDTIPLGVDFRAHIDRMVSECDVVLVLIGRRWVNATDGQGRRRLDQPGDYVRLEVHAALRRDIPVIPLLVDGASMPTEDQLPESLCELAYRNGIPVRYDPDFHPDMDRLVRGLASRRKVQAPAAPPEAPPELHQSVVKESPLQEVGLRPREEGSPISMTDVEQAALAAAPNIARAHCLLSEQEDGRAVLQVLVVPDAPIEPDGSVRFEDLVPDADDLQAVADRVRALVPPETSIVVEPALYQGVTIVVCVRARTGADVDAVAAEVRSALNRGFSPLTGGREGTGWEWGRILRDGDVYAVAAATREVEEVTDLALFGANPITGERGQRQRSISVPEGALLFSFDHRIKVDPT